MITVENVDQGMEDPKTKPDTEDADTTCFGVNLIKVARYINVIIGCTLIVSTILYIINIFEVVSNILYNPGRLLLNLFMV